MKSTLRAPPALKMGDICPCVTRNAPEGVQNIEYKPLHTNIPSGHQILLQQFGRVTHGKHQVLVNTGPSMTLASTAAMKDDVDLPRDW
jgi:hypothetical protein